MTEFHLRDKTLTIPTTTDELTPAQYQRFLLLSTIFAQGLISGRDLHIRWLSFLIGLRLPWTEYREEMRQQVESQQTAVDGFFDIVPSVAVSQQPDFEQLSPRLATTLQKVPEMEGWKAIGGDMLDGLSWGAFTEALDTLNMLRHIETAEESDALYQQITRLLYTPPVSSVDVPRQPPTLLVVAAVNHLLAVWNAIQHGPVSINGEDVDIRIIFQGGGHGADDKTGWAGITYEVATDGAFGTVPEVRTASMWDVLLYLYKCKFEEIHRKK